MIASKVNYIVGFTASFFHRVGSFVLSSLGLISKLDFLVIFPF